MIAFNTQQKESATMMNDKQLRQLSRTDRFMHKMFLEFGDTWSAKDIKTYKQQQLEHKARVEENTKKLREYLNQ